MNTTRILSLAMTMAMGMIAGLQASVTEHQPPAPLPEFKTTEQLAKWRTETTSKTSAEEASRLSTLESSTPFYTGKPYLAESGSYAFKYREYNPKMGRWTTVDPSGFPDGANNRVYAAVPTSEFDLFGCAAKSIIYNLDDALEHWASNAGGIVPAGNSVDIEIMLYPDYTNHIDGLKNVWENILKDVSKNASAGSISRNGTIWGVAGGSQTVGSVNLLFGLYTINWSASAWSNGERSISGSSIISFLYDDVFQFVWDPSAPIKTLLTDVIPSLRAGDGTPFIIEGKFKDKITASAIQHE